MSQNELQALTVLVTRPKPQGEVLCDLIKKAAGIPLFFPTIEIVSLTSSMGFQGAIKELNNYDWLIFISPQAVFHAAPFIRQCWPVFPANLKVAALGGGTAAALQEMHLPIHVYPEINWESEGLLALAEFQKVAGKKIALLRGEGGRELLTDELVQRGAQLTQVVAYKRCLPKVDITQYLSLLITQKIDIIITTSNEILHNLNTLLGKQAGSHLYTVPLVVVSDRMATLAKSIGFQTIILAKNASHEVMMATLKDHVCQMKLKKQ